MDFNKNSFPIAQEENSKTDMKLHFPQELIHPILLRLPVKPLCRFKSVSKPFQALMDSPDFINQLHKTGPKLFVEETLTKRKTRSTGFWICDMDDGSEEKIVFQGEVRFAGYCNGLFLLARGLRNLILLNPSTQQHRKLPTCPLKITHTSDCYNFLLGLGYDSVSDDYKVVSVPKKDGSEAWVLGLRSNIWRRIDCDVFPDASRHEFFIACFAHGNLYWLYESPITGLREIVAFDVAKEKFSRVTCPVAGSITGLHVLDGCLCVSFYSSAGIEEAHLYVTKKDGDDYSWHMICSVTSEQDLFFGIECFEKVKVIGYLKEGDKIMMDIGFEHMILYDLKRNSFEKTDVAGAYKFFIQAIIMFTGSLVSVGAGRTAKVLEPEIKRNEEINSFHNSEVYHMLCALYNMFQNFV